MPQVGTPIRFSVTPLEYGRAPPLLGEHTAAVLRERLAFDADTIAALAARGVIGVRRDTLARRGGHDHERRRARTRPPGAPRPRCPLGGDARSAFRGGRSNDPDADVLDRVRRARGGRALRRVAPVPARDSARQSRHHVLAHEALAKAEATAALMALAPDDARSAVRFAHDSATQNYVELEGGGRTAFGDAGQGRSLRAVLVGRAHLPAGRRERSHAPVPAGWRLQRLRPPRAGNLCARRRDQGALRGAPRAGLAEERATADWKFDFKPVRAARAVAADASRRARRPHVRLPARRKAGRGAHPAATDGGRRRAHRDRAVCARARRASSGGSARCAARTTRSPGSPGSRPALLYGLGGCILGVLWLAPPALAVRAVRRSLAGFVVGGLMAADGAIRRARRLVRLRHRAIGDDLLAAPGSARWPPLPSAAGLGLRAGVHGGRKPHAPRVRPSAAIVAPVVARGRRVARGARAHARRLRVRPARARARRRRSTTRPTAGSAGGSPPKC